MKNTIILALAVLSFQAAFAEGRNPGREPVRDPARGVREPVPGPIPGRDRLDLPMCLKDLHNANVTINDLREQLLERSRRCDASERTERENMDLRLENQRLNDTVNRLSFENTRLLDDNRDLRRQLDDLQNGRNRTLGFFSYAGCTDFTGNIDLKYIVGAEGRMALESETSAKQKVAGTYSCSYGIAIGKTEEIRSTQSVNYCVAGCKDFTGNVDQKYIQSGSGRNTTEAQYNALKAVASKFNCSYGIKVQACQ